MLYKCISINTHKSSVLAYYFGNIFQFAVNQSCMEIKDRVVEWLAYLKEKGISQSSMAKKIGKTRGYINGMSKGRTSIGTSAISHIMQIDENLNKNWLLFGEGDMYSRSNQQLADSDNYEEDNVNRLSKDEHIQSLRERVGELQKQLKIKDDQIRFLQKLIEEKQ
jgi:transcriptional regulator with XRE-family HTH domain